MVCLPDYKKLKVLEETENVKYFTAESGEFTYLVNAFCDRRTISRYMPVFAGLSIERTPEFSVWFSENSVLYAVFKFEDGIPILKYLEKEKLSVKYRLLMLKSVAYRLTELETEPPLLSRTVVEPENIIISEGGIRFNYKIPELCEYMEQSGVYYGFSELLDTLFSEGEISKNAGLRIVSEKCEKCIYNSFAELVRDIDGQLKHEERELDLKEAVLEKHRNRIKAAKNALVIVCVIMVAAFLYYEYVVKSREGVPSFAPLTEIGDVSVDKYAVYEAETELEDEKTVVYVYGKETAPEAPQAVLAEPVTPAPPEIAAEPEADIGEASENIIYTVQPDDNLTRICILHYGSSGMVSRIAEYNRLNNPNLLFAGQELLLPPLETFESAE